MTDPRDTMDPLSARLWTEAAHEIIAGANVDIDERAPLPWVFDLSAIDDAIADDARTDLDALPMEVVHCRHPDHGRPQRARQWAQQARRQVRRQVPPWLRVAP